jgi:hypothetical protein
MSYRSFRIMTQGVPGDGEAKDFNVRSRSESKCPQATRDKVCSPVVITTRPEASRSMRG